MIGIMNCPYHGRVSPIVRSNVSADLHLAYFICPHCQVMLGAIDLSKANAVGSNFLKAA